jgi:O-antigen/teichoic acid export membrane protein
MKRRVRDGFWALGGGVLASAALQYVLYFGVARCLGAEAYGTFSLALTVAVLAGPLCDLGTSVSLVRTTAQRPESMARTFGAALLLRALLTLPVGVLAFAVSAWIGHPQEVLALLPALYLATCCDGVAAQCASAFQAWERMGTAAAITVLRNLLRGVALLCGLLLDAGPGTLGLLFLAASVLATMPALWLVLRRTHLEFHRADLWPVLRDALPFGSAIVATILHAQIDVAMLGAFCGPEDVGQYHAGMRFLVLAQLVPQVVAMASAPLSYRVAVDGLQPSAHVYRIKATALALLGLAGTLLLATHGELLVQLCLGSRYAGSAPLLVAAAPALFVKFLASALGDTLGAIGRQRVLSIGCWSALLVNVGANLWLLPELGTTGAVLAMLISQTFLLGVLCAGVLWSGIPLAFRSVLAHPLWIAAAAGFGWAVSGNLASVLAATCIGAALLVRWPTREERVLLPFRG